MSLFDEHLLWILGAAALGFSTSAVFAGYFRLRRSTYLLAYIPFIGAYSLAFFQRNVVDARALLVDGWLWGMLAAGLVGAVAIKNVLSQPSSPRRAGGGLFIDLLWPGLLYGLADGVFLSVLPILAATRGLSGTAWATAWPGSLLAGFLALLASLVVTFFYHLGYPEFRRAKPMVGALIGNGLFSLAYLISGNPLAAVLPHVAMHMAAMVHGRDTTLQLPPHTAPANPPRKV